jgi:predicted murein hydrolase (TIGR00659 family)
MSLHLLLAWHSAVTSPVFGITVTLLAYVVARRLWDATGRHSLANPVLVCIVLIGGLLLVTGIDYDDYMVGGSVIGFLLGPATVALAVPLYRQLEQIRASLLPVLIGVTVGCCTAIVVGFALTRALGGSEQLALSMAPKSATTPVSIALAETVGGSPSLTAVFTIISGVLGAVAGPAVLTLLRLRDHRVRGLAIGLVSHGIGTSRALHEDPVEGAFSGMAMALNALATSLALPLLLLWLR